ncbi:MAG: efflux RND transporter periplasmic adaptor subunit [Planctomycetota bacterium]
MKKVLLLLLVVVLVAGVFGLNRLRTRESGKSLLHVAAADPLSVVVTQPQHQSIVRRVQAPGDIEAVFQVEISSEIPAKIEEMPVVEGDTVQAGQLLCRLSDDEYGATVESGEASVARLRAVIRQAEADLEKCQRDWARQERLQERNATSDNELADYRTALIKSEAAVEVGRHQLAEAEAMLRRARENLQKTVITSPIDGVISKIQAKLGEVVVTGTMNNPGTVIMTVTDLSPMQVKARVDETDVPLVKTDQPVDIFLPSNPQRAIPGRVLRVSTSGTRPPGRDVVTFETLVLVESDDPAIKPGMTANVEIQVARKDDVLTVPVQAVVHRKRKDLPEKLVEEFDRRQAELGLEQRQNRAQYLPVVFSKDEGRARPHLVRIGIADETHVELLEGLAAGETVIVGPYRSLDQLKDGTEVKLEETQEGVKPGGGETQVANDAKEKSERETEGKEVAETQ